MGHLLNPGENLEIPNARDIKLVCKVLHTLYGSHYLHEVNSENTFNTQFLHLVQFVFMIITVVCIPGQVTEQGFCISLRCKPLFQVPTIRSLSFG